MKDNNFKRMIGELVIAAYNTGYEDGGAKLTDIKEEEVKNCTDGFCAKCGKYRIIGIGRTLPVRFCPSCGKILDMIQKENKKNDKRRILQESWC
jgi:hypothetical protein